MGTNGEFHFNNVNIRFYNFDDIFIISRPKFASRSLDELYKVHIKKKCDLELRDINSGLNNYYINPITKKAKNTLDNDETLEKLKEEVVSEKKLTKLEKKKGVESVDFLKEEQEKIKEIWYSIVNGTYEGKVVIVYRDPYEALVTGICQDVFSDMTHFYNTLKDYKIIFDIAKDVYVPFLSHDIKQFKPIQTPDNYYLNKDVIKLWEKDGFDLFFSHFFINHIETKGLSTQHKGTYLSNLIPMLGFDSLEKYYFVNLDAADEIDFKKILLDVANINITDLLNSTNKVVSSETRKLSNNFYKNIAKETIGENDNIYLRIKEFLETEFRYYDIIKNHSNNIQ